MSCETLALQLQGYVVLQATQSDVWEGLTTSPAPVHTGNVLQDNLGILFLYSLPGCQSAVGPMIEIVLEFMGILVCTYNKY